MVKGPARTAVREDSVGWVLLYLRPARHYALARSAPTGYFRPHENTDAGCGGEWKYLWDAEFTWCMRRFSRIRQERTLPQGERASAAKNAEWACMLVVWEE